MPHVGRVTYCGLATCVEFFVLLLYYCHSLSPTPIGIDVFQRRLTGQTKASGKLSLRPP